MTLDEQIRQGLATVRRHEAQEQKRPHTARPGALGEISTRILAIVRKRGRQSTDQIVNQLIDLPRARVRVTIWSLTNRGLLKRVAVGRAKAYILPGEKNEPA